MEKVKVTRYMPGRRPDYAIESSSESSSEEEEEGPEEHGGLDELEGEGIGRDRIEELEEQRREYDEKEVAKDRRLARLRERSTHVER